MKIFIVIFLVCLLLTGTVSAKAATSSVSSIVNPGIYSPIYATSGVSYCSDNLDSAGIPDTMGELDVASTPDGTSISIDGSLWMIEHCIALPWPNPPLCTPMAAISPVSGQLDTGSHSITIAHTGYKNYVGTVNICSQKVTYVDATLTAITTATTTVPTTTVTSTATTAVTTTTTAAATSAPTSTTTTAPVTVLTSVATSSSTVVPAGSGSLSVTTTPAGASVFIDGVQRGVSPATIPGLPAGSHTVLLKLDGYQDLSTPVTITAGTTSEFSTGLTQLPAGGTTVPATTASGAAATKTRSPGFEAAAAACAVVALLLLRKTNP